MTPAEPSMPPIRVECPTCRTSLLTPRQHAAKQYRCPKCDTVFSPPGQDGPTGSTLSFPIMAGNQPIAPPPPPLPASMRTARLISAKEAKSPLEMAEDGKLPILLLAEGEEQERQPRREMLNSPIALSSILCISLILSVILLLVDTQPTTTTETLSKQEARQAIQAEFFADLGSESPTRQYQIFLREAHRAYARQDYEKERYYYRRVLYLLRGERNERDSLTGNPENDRQLQDYIWTIMATE